MTGNKKKKRTITALQFFVGALVTFGGIEFAREGAHLLGTALGLAHLSMGLSGLFAGYCFLNGKSWSRAFVLAINGATIGYSAFSETLVLPC